MINFDFEINHLFSIAFILFDTYNISSYNSYKIILNIFVIFIVYNILQKSRLLSNFYDDIPIKT